MTLKCNQPPLIRRLLADGQLAALVDRIDRSADGMISFDVLLAFHLHHCQQLVRNIDDSITYDVSQLLY